MQSLPEPSLLSLLEWSGRCHSCLSFFLLLPDRGKGWKEPGAEVMIDDTPPPVHTSLLTHSHSATLFSTNWATLQTLRPANVGSRSEPTTHSTKCLSYPALIKHCTQETHCGTVYCVLYICQKLCHESDRRVELVSLHLEQVKYIHWLFKVYAPQIPGLSDIQKYGYDESFLWVFHSYTLVTTVQHRHKNLSEIVFLSNNGEITQMHKSYCIYTHFKASLAKQPYW